MRAWLPIAAAFLLAVPAAAAEPVTLYAHIDGLNDFPVTVEAPPPDHVAEVGLGLLTHSLGCAPPPPSGTVDLVKTWHVYHGFLSASPVSYEDGHARYDMDRGLASDLRFDGNVTPVFHWYVSAGDEVGLGVPLDVEAHVSLFPGIPEPSGGRAYEAEDPIAVGRSAPVGMMPGGPEHSVVDGRDVYHFEVPLEMSHASVPSTGAWVRVDLRAALPVCGGEGENVMLDEMRIHSSKDHRPRLELGLEEAARVTSFDTRSVDGNLLLRAAVESGLGPAAIRGATLRIEGPDGAIPTVDPVRTEGTHCHCYPLPPDTFTWVLDDSGWPEGAYTFEITLDTSTGHTLFEGQFSKPAEANAPGPGMAWALVGLVGLAALLGRRRTPS